MVNQAGRFEARDIIAQAPTGLAIIGLDGQLLHSNAAWRALLATDPAAEAGLTWQDCLAPVEHANQAAHLAPLLKEERRDLTAERRYRRRSGRPVWVLENIGLQRDPQGRPLAFIVQIQDISERRRAEAALRALTAGTAGVTGDDFFRVLVGQLAEVFQVHTAFVTQCADEPATRVRTLAYMEQYAFCPNFEYNLEGTPCRYVIDGSPYYQPDHLADSFPREQGKLAYLGLPIFDSAGRVLGHLAIVDDRPMLHGLVDAPILEIFALRAGVELERQQAERALRRLNAELEENSHTLARKVEERTRELERRQQAAAGLRDVLAILNSNRPIPEILDLVVGQAVRVLDAHSGIIFRWQAEGGLLTVQAAYGWPAAVQLAPPLSADQGLVGAAIMGDRPTAVTDIAAAFAADASAWAVQVQRLYRTLLVTPFVRQGGTDSEAAERYGGLVLFYTEPHLFSAEELALALILSDQAALAVENARLRQRVEESAIMEERARLARDLHDSVTQSLYSLTLLAEGWRRLAADGRLEDAGQSLGEIGEIAQQALKEMRLLVHQLRPPALAQQTLAGALRERLEAVENRSGVTTHLAVEEDLALPSALEDALYRIAQEALNNILKHAHASRVAVQVQRVDQAVELAVIDNGVGFDSAERAGGLGLDFMQERVARLGGTLDLAAAPGQGTRLRVRLPVTGRDR